MQCTEGKSKGSSPTTLGDLASPPTPGCRGDGSLHPCSPKLPSPGLPANPSSAVLSPPQLLFICRLEIREHQEGEKSSLGSPPHRIIERLCALLHCVVCGVVRAGQGCHGRKITSYSSGTAGIVPHTAWGDIYHQNLLMIVMGLPMQALSILWGQAASLLLFLLTYTLMCTFFSSGVSTPQDLLGGAGDGSFMSTPISQARHSDITPTPPAITSCRKPTGT